jgi:hypothetical protein
LQTQIEVQVISEQGESLASVAGPVKEWDGERIYFPWRTNLDLSHSDWQDIALPGSGNFALEVSVSQVDSQGQSLQAQAALDFRQGSG